ncbi:MAG TPA: phosphoribosylamine--glycine ligase, partial [Epsilonproteobacteria bacterium]|nr:phosphoribosylamine--glycine ligase [Campylobacterota bacterium]
MDILIVGSGGREYSIGLALHQENKSAKLYFSPGNGATENLGVNIPFGDFEALCDFVEANEIGLTIVGPEAPLVDGIVDAFKARGLTIFGPSA